VSLAKSAEQIEMLLGADSGASSRNHIRWENSFVCCLFFAGSRGRAGVQPTLDPSTQRRECPRPFIGAMRQPRESRELVGVCGVYVRVV